MNSLKNIQNEKGSTLITVIFFITLLTMMGVTVTVFVQNNSTAVATDLQSLKAFYTAQSAIDYGVRKSFNSNNWHWSSSSMAIAGGTASITVDDSTLVPSLKDTLRIRVVATSGNAVSRQTYRTRVIDISGLAVYISGTMADVTVRDSLGNANPALGFPNATELPDMDVTKMKQMAIAEGHYFGSSLSMDNGSFYPTGKDSNFFHVRPNGVPSDTPNVVYIEGDLEVKNKAQIFGIIVVTGDVVLKNSQKLQGVLYMPNPVSVVHQIDLDNKETAYGGIFGGANIEGNGNDAKINVFYRSLYVKRFFSDYAVNGLPYVSIYRNWKQL